MQQTNHYCIMNPVQFECPYCHAITAGDETLYGQRVECPMCHEVILVLGVPVGSAPRTAQLVSSPVAGAPMGRGAADPETDIFLLAPVARAFPGWLLGGVGLVVLGIGAATLAPNYSWPTWVALLPAVPGLLLLLAVWGRVKSCSYRLTTQRLFVRRGWLARHVNELELYRVKDVVVDQGVLERLLGYGTITVLADDDSTPAIHLVGVAGPTEVKETIRTHYRAARQREGVRPTEFLQTP